MAEKAAAVLLCEATKRPERFDDIVERSTVGAGKLGRDLDGMTFPKERTSADLSAAKESLGGREPGALSGKEVS